MFLGCLLRPQCAEPSTLCLWPMPLAVGRPDARPSEHAIDDDVVVRVRHFQPIPDRARISKLLVRLFSESRTGRRDGAAPRSKLANMSKRALFGFERKCVIYSRHATSLNRMHKMLDRRWSHSHLGSTHRLGCDVAPPRAHIRGPARLRASTVVRAFRRSNTNTRVFDEVPSTSLHLGRPCACPMPLPASMSAVSPLALSQQWICGRRIHRLSKGEPSAQGVSAARGAWKAPNPCLAARLLIRSPALC